MGEVMSVQAQNVRDIAQAIFEEELAKAKGADVKTRLRAVRDACEDIIQRGGTPNAPSIQAWIANHRPSVKLTKRTIYNQREYGGVKTVSPYSRVISAWAAVSQEKAVAKKARGSEPAAASVGGFLTTNDLASISDLVVRHKVAILYGQVNQLKNQAEMRKAIRENPVAPRLLGAVPIPLSIDSGNSSTINSTNLTDDELDALEDFLREASAKRRGLTFNDLGAVIAKRAVTGSALSKPGFVDALRKILQTYSR
ncbi:hypothetical protein KOM00_12300 [Geomonas sp. Red69]|uniref:gamma-mobile-trio protein GmtX n=1 Tax=Geomonas diazotrophica TaxID=2843197 RepID=UPI001C0F719C|nr:gamma-mobile-trio protein GmtX [Geomonas diazotrophica]MBU5637509.1 hypothetical protein [Geomonas diazotrophica]